MRLEYSVHELLNREPPVRDLISNFITERDGYDRNHGPIPNIIAEEHIVLVNGAVKKPLTLTVDQLRHEFRQHEVICTLSCAGNRRHTMRTLLKEVQGIDWNDGAIMNCAWKGPRLKDILNDAGVEIDDYSTGHVEFACYQTSCQEDEWYGASLELGRVMSDDAEILLALEMNGQVLPPRNGHPVRLIAPGVSGCRSVKWLDRITVQHEESSNFYQQRDYKILPPEAVDSDSAAPYWSITPPIIDTLINSVIATPQNGETIYLSSNGTCEVKGYAVPQGDQGPIIRVEVSVDDGHTWMDAELSGCPQGNGKWCWALWRASIALERGSMVSIYSRATDSGGNTQPRVSPWNLRGVGYNGYGSAVGVKVHQEKAQPIDVTIDTS